MRSWTFVRLNTSLERSVDRIEPPLASMCSLDKEKVFPRIDNADFNFKRNNTLTCSAICRSLAVGLLPSARWSPRTDAHLFLFWLPTVPAVSSERRRTLLVSCPSGACQVSCCHCMLRRFMERRAAICIRCRCLTRLVFASVITSSIGTGNTKGKLFTKSKSNGELILLHLLHGAGQYRQRMRSQHFFRSRFARSLTLARWPARQSISECSAGKHVRPISCEQTTDRQCYFKD